MENKITITCPACNTQLEVSEDMNWKTVNCPICNESITLDLHNTRSREIQKLMNTQKDDNSHFKKFVVAQVCMFIFPTLLFYISTVFTGMMFMPFFKMIAYLFILCAILSPIILLYYSLYHLIEHISVRIAYRIHK